MITRMGVVLAAAGLVLVPTLDAQDRPRTVVPVLLKCDGDLSQNVRALHTAIAAAVEALPGERRTGEDIEAAITYAISQTQTCPGVPRMVLAQLAGGSGAYQQAAQRVLASLLPSGTPTVAGLRNVGSGSAFGNSFFSLPIVGVGGGTANYSR